MPAPFCIYELLCPCVGSSLFPRFFICHLFTAVWALNSYFIQGTISTVVYSDGRVAPDWPRETRQAGTVLCWVSRILWTHPSFLVRNVRFPCGFSASALQPVLSPRGGEHPGMRSGCHGFWALAALSAPSSVSWRQKSEPGGDSAWFDSAVHSIS